MRVYNVYEAKTHLSKLLERAENGEEIVIARAGRPVAKLSSYKENKVARKPGLWQDQLLMNDTMSFVADIEETES